MKLHVAKTGVDRLKKRKKKKIVPIFVHTQPGEENSEKNSKKIRKIEKTPFWHYF